MTTGAARPADPNVPHLQLVSPEPAPPQRSTRSAAERIAEQTGGAIETGEGGVQTVHFPAPDGGEPMRLAPAVHDLARAHRGRLRARHAENAPASAGSDPRGRRAKKAADHEEMYEYFLDRFKRDLLVEREQSGYLIIDNP